MATTSKGLYILNENTDNMLAEFVRLFGEDNSNIHKIDDLIVDLEQKIPSKDEITGTKVNNATHADEAGKVGSSLGVSSNLGTKSYNGSSVLIIAFDDSSFLANQNGAQINIKLKPTGVQGGTYNKVTVSEEGLVVAATQEDYATKEEVDKKLDKTGGTIEGNLAVGGNLTVGGETSIVDAKHLQVEDKIIEVAKDNTEPLTSPAGIVAPKYDGENSGGIVFDSNGIAYVGDVKRDDKGNVISDESDLQALATRVGLKDGELVKYDAEKQTLVPNDVAYQSVADNSLKTENKKIPDAINELFDKSGETNLYLATNSEEVEKLLTNDNVGKYVRYVGKTSTYEPIVLGNKLSKVYFNIGKSPEEVDALLAQLDWDNPDKDHGEGNEIIYKQIYLLNNLAAWKIKGTIDDTYYDGFALGDMDNDLTCLCYASNDTLANAFLKGERGGWNEKLQTEWRKARFPLTITRVGICQQIWGQLISKSADFAGAVCPIEVGDTIKKVYFNTAIDPDLEKITDWTVMAEEEGVYRIDCKAIFETSNPDVTIQLMRQIDLQTDERQYVIIQGPVLDSEYAVWAYGATIKPSDMGFDHWGWQISSMTFAESGTVTSIAEQQNIWGEYISKESFGVKDGEYKTGEVYEIVAREAYEPISAGDVLSDLYFATDKTTAQTDAIFDQLDWDNPDAENTAASCTTKYLYLLNNRFAVLKRIYESGEYGYAFGLDSAFLYCSNERISSDFESDGVGWNVYYCNEISTILSGEMVVDAVGANQNVWGHLISKSPDFADSIALKISVKQVENGSASGIIAGNSDKSGGEFIVAESVEPYKTAENIGKYVNQTSPKPNSIHVGTVLEVPPFFNTALKESEVEDLLSQLDWESEEVSTSGFGKALALFKNDSGVGVFAVKIDYTYEETMYKGYTICAGHSGAPNDYFSSKSLMPLWNLFGTAYAKMFDDNGWNVYGIHFAQDVKEYPITVTAVGVQQEIWGQLVSNDPANFHAQVYEIAGTSDNPTAEKIMKLPVPTADDVGNMLIVDSASGQYKVLHKYKYENDDVDGNTKEVCEVIMDIAKVGHIINPVEFHFEGLTPTFYGSIKTYDDKNGSYGFRSCGLTHGTTVKVGEEDKEGGEPGEKVDIYGPIVYSLSAGIGKGYQSGYSNRCNGFEVTENGIAIKDYTLTKIGFEYYSTYEVKYVG